MGQNIQMEIKQRKPFASREEELFLNILRTADQLMRGLAEVLKPADLSATQYNVLRILRGAVPDGLACGEISDRMVTRDPDITRLLDRMEKRKLVARTREKADRRVVTARITEPGLDLLKSLDETVTRMHKTQLGHLDQRALDSLIKLLEQTRERPA
jgi:DNA-binding MarR family transcriptional regulator